MVFALGGQWSVFYFCPLWLHKVSLHFWAESWNYREKPATKLFQSRLSTTGWVALCTVTSWCPPWNGRWPAHQQLCEMPGDWCHTAGATCVALGQWLAAGSGHSGAAQLQRVLQPGCSGTCGAGGAGAACLHPPMLTQLPAAAWRGFCSFPFKTAGEPALVIQKVNICTTCKTTANLW